LFKIVGWLTADNTPIVQRTISAQEAKKIVDQREMDDGIPFSVGGESGSDHDGSLAPFQS